MQFSCFSAGAFVLGPGDQGIVYEERNEDFGAMVNVTAILESLEEVKKPVHGK